MPSTLPAAPGRRLEGFAGEDPLTQREELALLEADVGSQQAPELARRGNLAGRRTPDEVPQGPMLSTRALHDGAVAAERQGGEQTLLLDTKVRLELRREAAREGCPVRFTPLLGAFEPPSQHQRGVVVRREITEPRVAFHGGDDSGSRFAWQPPMNHPTSSLQRRVDKAPPAWLALGFRPFFLLASAFAVVATLGWLHCLRGDANPSAGYFAPVWWHAHEMLFGFTMAVVAGFLLTASRNWTQRDTPRGLPLAGLALLWLVGRATLVLPLPPWLRGLPTLVFMVALWAVLAHVLVSAQSRRNYGLLGILAALTAAAALMHLEAMGLVRGALRPATEGAVHLLVLLNVVIAGRIVPMFTRNRTGAPTRRVPAVDRAAIGLASAVGLLGAARHLAPDAEPVFAAVALASGLVQLLRMRTWAPRAGMRVPMLAVLFVGYGWIGLGHLALAAAHVLPALSRPLAMHALTLGVLGTMTLGMMARVTLGHTGRPIRADRRLRAAFVAIGVATLVRLSAAIVPSEAVPSTWIGAGLAFASAFLLLLWSIAGPLTQPRPDGRPG